MDQVIGMIHLKALPTSPFNEFKIDEIYLYALEDLKRLEESGIRTAIVENMFDLPYTQELSLETIVSFVKIFTLLKYNTNIDLGINLHATSGVEEIVIAELCGASFIRVENMVELRASSSGIMHPTASKILRKRKELGSSVQIFADVMVKESVELTSKPIETILQELASYKVDAIIISGDSTGYPPEEKYIKEILGIVKGIPLFIGSGVSSDNIHKYKDLVQGVIVGTAIKENNLVSEKISISKAKELVGKIR